MASRHFWSLRRVSPSIFMEDSCLVNFDSCEYFQVTWGVAIEWDHQNVGHMNKKVFLKWEMIVSCQGCSDKLHLWSYLDTVWLKTGYFGLLGNNHILFIILLHLTKGYLFIGLKQWIWEDPNETPVSLGRFSYP